MARMVPPAWEDRNGSTAEALIYRKLRDETPEDWFAVHSVGLASHRTKPWAEIDFVVIGPFGILCLEVKGGQVTVADGRWATNGSALKESPFAQAGSAAAALFREIEPHCPALRRAVVAHGVMLPDVTFEEVGAGIDQAIVYDDRDLETPIERYLTRLADHWLEFHGRVDERFRPLSRGDRTTALRYVAPSFDLVPTLRAHVAQTEAELIELTRAQAKILRGLRCEDRALIRGGAGTGKTLLAVEEATFFAGAGDRVLFCCRSEHLARFIAAHVRDPAIDVRSYEGLLTELVNEAGRWDRIPDASEEDIRTLFLPEEAMEAIIELGRDAQYGVLILDEAQDLLLAGALDVFDLLLDGGLAKGRWRVFLDQKQAVFSGVDDEQLDRIRRNTTSQFQLVDNCRNTPQICETTCMLSAVDPDDPLAADGPQVETRFALDRRDAVSAAAAIVKGWVRRSVAPEDIVVVATENGVAERVAQHWPSDAPPLVPWDVNVDRGVRMAVAADFKGLEARAVVVVGVDELHERATLQRMYVACSRARVLLGIVMDEAARDDFNVRAVEYARRNMQLADTGA